MSRRESLSRDANESTISLSQVNYPVTRAPECVAATPHFLYSCIRARTFQSVGTRENWMPRATQHFNIVVFVAPTLISINTVFFIRAGESCQSRLLREMEM